MKAKIYITLKPGVLDPQGRAIQGALIDLGFSGINEVRQGKFIEIDLATDNPESAHAQAEDMCRKLLANLVIENFRIELS